MPVCGQTCASAAALAVEEGPPSPAVKPVPIHGMGTAVRCRAYPVTGPASAKRNADDEHSSTIARTRACSSDGLRKRTRPNQLAKLITTICGSCARSMAKSSALTFSVWWRCSNGRCGQGNTHLSFHFDHDSSCVIGDQSRSRSRSSSPNVCPCACSCSRVKRKCPATANARRLQLATRRSMQQGLACAPHYLRLRSRWAAR